MSQVGSVDSGRWPLVVGAGCFFVILYFISPILPPFLVSLVLAYLADPFVSWLEGMKISRTLGVLTTFVFLLLTFLFGAAIVVPILWEEIHGLLAEIPVVVTRVQSAIIEPVAASLKLEVFNVSGDVVRETLMSHWKEVGSLANSVLSELGHSSSHALRILGYGLLVPVVTFYLLRDWAKLIKKLGQLVPEGKVEVVQSTVKDIDSVLSEFLRGQLLIMFLLGVFYGLALRVIGLEYALIVGFVAGVVSFIPYFGSIVGILLASLVALGQADGVWLYLIVLAIFALGQLLESLVLSPILIGDKIGLHPVWIILAVMIGGHLFGFVGILLALPVGAIVRVLVSRIIGESLSENSSRQSE